MMSSLFPSWVFGHCLCAPVQARLFPATGFALYQSRCDISDRILPVYIAPKTSMKCVDDFRLRFGTRELVPIMVGGMGVDISTADLALEAARLGGIGHISDAMVQTVSDRRFQTHFVK